MSRRNTVLVFVIFVLIAAIAALLAFFLWQPQEPTPVAQATLPPTATDTATPTATPNPTASHTPSPMPVAQFGPIKFGTGYQSGQLQNPGASFPAGTALVHAVWSYRGMASGASVRLAWSLDGTPWSDQTLLWDTTTHGATGPAYASQIGQPGGRPLPAGRYRLELSIEGQPVQSESFVILWPTPTSPPPSPTPKPGLQQIGRQAVRSLVKLLVPDDLYDGYGVGSGSAVDGGRGLILTNWHVMVDEWGRWANEQGWAQVHTTTDPDSPPSFVYWARLRPEYSDAEADLAILQISHYADGSWVDYPVDLPAIELGDSDLVRLGDHVLMLGFPNYAEGRVSWTEGLVADRDHEWIRSDAGVSHGHSGGMLLNAEGQLIGVPTEYEETTTGVVFVKARPSNLAAWLVESAIVGSPVSPPEPPSGEEEVGNLRVVLGAPGLNLRAGPSLEKEVVGELEPGTVVEVLQAPEWDGERFWYYVRDLEGGDSGWASEVYLAAWEVAQQPILFSADWAGTSDIYGVLPDGSDLRLLTGDPGAEGDASWSPDGSRIVFTYTPGPGADADLYLMNADGADWAQLTFDEADDVHPVWSPNGAAVAYVSNRDGDWELWLLDLEGGGRQLTFNDSWDSFPSWSPDSEQLVFTSRRTGNYDLFLLDLATGAEMQLTHSPYADAHPDWSPRGDEIVYTRVVEEGGDLLRQIAILDLYDPAHPRLVTDSPLVEALHHYPDWSPDGLWITFTSGQGGEEALYVVPARGGPLMALPGVSVGEDTTPSWSY